MGWEGEQELSWQRKGEELCRKRATWKDTQDLKELSGSGGAWRYSLSLEQRISREKWGATIGSKGRYSLNTC